MLAVLDMPTGPDLGPWLDRALMSPDLAGVVNDLTVIHDAKIESPTVDDARDWLGADATAVFERGLRALAHDRLRELLVRPAMLLAIQELVLIDGGRYWNSLATEGAGSSLQKPRQSEWPRWFVAIGPIAIAASLVAFIAVDSIRPKQGAIPGKSDLAELRKTSDSVAKLDSASDQAWGWNRHDLLKGVASPAAIPVRLAERLEEWFALPAIEPNDRAALRRRLGELWAGCEHALSLPLDGVQPKTQQRLRDSMHDLQDRIGLLLDTLESTTTADTEPGVAATTKNAADDCIRNAAETFRSVR